MNPTLKVKIITPKQIIFQGEAIAVSSTNSAGKFDILPAHANFISLVENSPIVIILPNKEKKSFTFPLAIIYTTKNNVNIFTDIQIEFA